METPSKHQAPQVPLAIQVMLFVGALGVMVALMYYSITDLYPSGKTLGVAGFVRLWFREIVIVAFAVIGIVAILVLWVVLLIRRMLAGAKDAL